MMLKKMLSTLVGMFGRNKNEKAEKIIAFRNVEPLKIKPAEPYQRGGSRSSKHHLGRVYHGKRPNAPSAAISFRPLGSPLTMKIRPNLRWGHMSRARRVRLSNIAARKSAA